MPIARGLATPIAHHETEGRPNPHLGSCGLPKIRRASMRDLVLPIPLTVHFHGPLTHRLPRQQGLVYLLALRSRSPGSTRGLP